MSRPLPFVEMDELRGEFAAFCAEAGYADRANVPQRLIDLGAAFAWLMLNPDEPPVLN